MTSFFYDGEPGGWKPEIPLNPLYRREEGTMQITV